MNEDLIIMVDCLFARCKMYLEKRNFSHDISTPSGLYWQVPIDKMLNTDSEILSLNVGDFDYEIGLFLKRMERNDPPTPDELSLLGNIILAIYSNL